MMTLDLNRRRRRRQSNGRTASQVLCHLTRLFFVQHQQREMACVLNLGVQHRPGSSISRKEVAPVT